jgi:hypothetical protein
MPFASGTTTETDAIAIADADADASVWSISISIIFSAFCAFAREGAPAGPPQRQMQSQLL